MPCTGGCHGHSATRCRACPATHLAGMLPFARELLRAGTRVVIAANELPSINDITAAELDALLPQVGVGWDGGGCGGLG